MTESKADFRRRIRQECPALDAAVLQEQILSHPWFQNAGTIMAYWALPKEPDLTAVLEATWAQGKRLLLPRCDDERTMTARQILSSGELKPGTMGIWEPGADAPVVPSTQIDLILVPGLAFDPSCRRMGKGRGYYDRFLENYHGKTMGVCGVLVPEVPVEGHDVLMDAVVTAKGIFYRTEANACLERS